MAKRKNYWYVLVLTAEGPVFVTGEDNLKKVAYWNRNEQPLEMAQVVAKDLAWALCVNGYSAFAVDNFYELESQPYRYDIGHFEWVREQNEEEEE